MEELETHLFTDLVSVKESVKRILEINKELLSIMNMRDALTEVCKISLYLFCETKII